MNLYSRVTLNQLSKENARSEVLSETPNGMRALLDRYAREHPLPAQIFNIARHQGLSGEDKYTMLAYHALLQMERYEKMALDTLARMPISPMVIVSSDTVKKS